MCGRYAFKMTWQEIHDLLAHGVFPARLEAMIRDSFNVAPTHSCLIVNNDGQERVGHEAKWGFVPSWWDKPEPPKHTINARTETVATSGMFRSAFKSSRCLVPASGYYEWQVQADGSKQPVFIHRADGKPKMMGGIRARRDDGDSFAILTTTAPHGMEAIHDRSPVIVEPETIDRWLAGTTDAAEVHGLCKPAADGILAWHKVDKAVGRVANNRPELMEPLRE